MKTSQYLSLAALLLLPSSVFGSVLIGPSINPANGHAYYLVSSNTWAAAEAEAVSLGGHLATINDAAENAWVLSTFGDFNGIQCALWIGLLDEVSEGNFVWISGESVTYQNWNAGEPNNGSGFVPHENHAAIRGLGFSPSDVWNDVADEDIYLGVVEVVLSPPVLSDIRTYAGFELSGVPGVNYRVEYSTSMQSTNWLTLTNITLPYSPYLIVDTSAPVNSQRFYRAAVGN